MIKSSRIKWAGHVAKMGEKEECLVALVGKEKGKRPLGRPRCRWVYNIKKDLGGIEWKRGGGGY
jgi:hypothetical protein